MSLLVVMYLHVFSLHIYSWMSKNYFGWYLDVGPIFMHLTLICACPVSTARLESNNRLGHRSWRHQSTKWELNSEIKLFYSCFNVILRILQVSCVLIYSCFIMNFYIFVSFAARLSDHVLEGSQYLPLCREWWSGSAHCAHRGSQTGNTKLPKEVVWFLLRAVSVWRFLSVSAHFAFHTYVLNVSLTTELHLQKSQVRLICIAFEPDWWCCTFNPPATVSEHLVLGCSRKHGGPDWWLLSAEWHLWELAYYHTQQRYREKKERKIDRKKTV